MLYLIFKGFIVILIKFNRVWTIGVLVMLAAVIKVDEVDHPRSRASCWRHRSKSR